MSDIWAQLIAGGFGIASPLAVKLVEHYLRQRLRREREQRRDGE